VLSSLRSHAKAAIFDHLPGVLRKGPAAGKRVALTFDDGPDELTERYLDLLDDLAIPATFFLLGKLAAARPALVREYVRRGHQVASHGYDHTAFPKLSRRALLDQCARTDEQLGGQLTGRPWTRPPFGAVSPGSLLALRAAGYTIAMWSRDSMDYSTQDPAVVAASCAPDVVEPGDVLLLHEGQAWTLAALPRIVAGLHAAGFECVTMHDLFST
jgi:peptidoglycan/xylan/chitin deacetylase (PgdA/CDA1 family)